MGEHFIVDNSMTPDWELVPLGPVDKEGNRVPLDTEVLYDEDGCVIRVESYRFSTWSKRWTADVYIADQGMEVYVDSYYLHRPDSYERVLEDLYEAVQQGERSGRPYCVYNVARGLCRGHEDKDGKCKLVGFADACTLTMTGDIWSRVERLCKGDGAKDGSEK